MVHNAHPSAAHVPELLFDLRFWVDCFAFLFCFGWGSFRQTGIYARQSDTGGFSNASVPVALRRLERRDGVPGLVAKVP